MKYTVMIPTSACANGFLLHTQPLDQRGFYAHEIRLVSLMIPYSTVTRLTGNLLIGIRSQDGADLKQNRIIFTNTEGVSNLTYSFLCPVDFSITGEDAVFVYDFDRLVENAHVGGVRTYLTELTLEMSFVRSDVSPPALAVDIPFKDNSCVSMVLEIS